jgi:16S rRNA (guanine966-N2)-methyltransferase
MRIVAGLYGGRILHETHGHRTHPMSEKIRGALFNALGDLEGLTVLDAFTGTGAVAIEALSRGAKSVIAIDQDKEAYRCAAKNVEQLRLQEVMHVTQANTSSWSDRHARELFDIVIADPPYDDIRKELLHRLAVHVRQGGIYVLSLPSEYSLELPVGFNELSTKSYGDAKLLYLRKTQKC